MARTSRPNSRKNRNPDESEELSISEAHPGKRTFPSEFIRLYGKLALRSRYRIRLEGLGNLPESGPTLVLAKHQRLEDVPIGLSALVESNRPRKMDIWCVMKDDLVKNKYAAGFFLGAGGIPLNRKDPQKSKEQLLFAREKLHAGKIVVVFPEQTFYPWKMGKGRPAGFRFITGKPAEPIAVNCVGFEYDKRKFPRIPLTVRIGPPTLYTVDHDPEHFLHDRMEELAALSNLHYKFERPKGRKNGARDDE